MFGGEQPYVFLYTTAGGAKLPYRRGVLDALCYPNDHVIRYRYRIREISPKIRNFAGLNLIPAVIIFVDSYKGIPEEPGISTWKVDYYPLRYCEIIHNDAFYLTQALDTQARIDFSLKLGPLIHYDMNNRNQWQSLAQHDKLRNMKDGKPEYFVISTSSAAFSFAHPDQNYAWENVVRHISQSHNMKHCIFLRMSRPQLRITAFRRLRERFQLPPANRSKEVMPFTEGFLTSYTVRPAREYRIDITIFDSPYDTSTGLGQHSELSVKASSDQVYVAQPFHSIVSGLIERSVILSFKRTTESFLTTLVFTVTDVKENTTTNTPVFHLYITPGWLIMLAFLFFVTAGTFLISSDEKRLKGVGTLFIFFAAFIAYRKLPVASGSN